MTMREKKLYNKLYMYNNNYYFYFLLFYYYYYYIIIFLTFGRYDPEGI